MTPLAEGVDFLVLVLHTIILHNGKGNMRNVWQSRRTGDGWSAPTSLLETTYGVYDFMPTASANYYVGSDSSPEDVNNGSTYVFSLLTFSNSAG